MAIGNFLKAYAWIKFMKLGLTIFLTFCFSKNWELMGFFGKFVFPFTTFIILLQSEMSIPKCDFKISLKNITDH